MFASIWQPLAVSPLPEWIHYQDNILFQSEQQRLQTPRQWKTANRAEARAYKRTALLFALFEFVF